MKCRYVSCKYGGNVEKSEAVKVGGSYFHKECLEEKHLKTDIENFYIEYMPKTTLQLLRKVILQLIEEYKYSPRYIYYVLTYIKKYNKPINNPFGLINYCSSTTLLNKYKKMEVNKKFNEIKNDILLVDNKSKIKFKYTPNTKKETDLI